jgi:heme/copper-type cytochrome/quinol oxidase subunit 2
MFQEPATVVMAELTDLHNTLMLALFGVVIFVFVMMVILLVRFSTLYVTPERLSSKVTHNSSLEFI